MFFVPLILHSFLSYKYLHFSLNDLYSFSKVSLFLPSSFFLFHTNPHADENSFLHFLLYSFRVFSSVAPVSSSPRPIIPSRPQFPSLLSSFLLSLDPSCTGLHFRATYSCVCVRGWAGGWVIMCACNFHFCRYRNERFCLIKRRRGILHPGVYLNGLIEAVPALLQAAMWN